MQVELAEGWTTCPIIFFHLLCLVYGSFGFVMVTAYSIAAWPCRSRAHIAQKSQLSPPGDRPFLRLVFPVARKPDHNRTPDFALIICKRYNQISMLLFSNPPVFKGNDGDHWANDTITGEPYRTYCTLCSAGYACNATGLTTPDVLCAGGYFCKLGAADPLPYCAEGEGLCTYGVCPAGHYCPTGTSDPVVCPPGEGPAFRRNRKQVWDCMLKLSGKPTNFSVN